MPPKPKALVRLKPNRAPHVLAPLASNRRLLPVKVAAQRLGLSVWGVRAAAYSGRISSHKLFNRLMIAEDEVDRVIAESERPRLVFAKPIPVGGTL